VLLNRGLAALITIALVTPVLMNKKPASERSLAFPLVLWSVLLLLLLTATAINRIWPAFGVALVQLILLPALALRRLWCVDMT
jgi:hypothetical protein